MNRDQLLNLTLTDLSFKELVALFKRRKWVVWITTLLFLAVGVVATLVMPAEFRAGTMVIVEGKTQANPNNSPNDVVGAFTQSSFDYDVATQIQIMSSFDVLYESLKRIGYPIPARLTQAEYEKWPKVSVQQVQTTNMVQIGVEHTNFDYTSTLAGKIPEVYKEFVLEIQKDNIDRSKKFIEARIEEEKKNQQAVMQEIAAYKAENGVADSRTESDIRAGNLADAERKYAESDGDVVAAEAALQQAKSQLDSLPKTIPYPTTVTRSDALQRAEDTLTVLNQQRESLLVNNLEDSDRVRRVDAQIVIAQKTYDDLKANRTVNTDSVVRNPLMSEYERNYDSLKAAVDGTKAKREALRVLVDQRRSEMKNLATIVSKLQEMELRLNESVETGQNLAQTQDSIALRDNALQSPLRNVTGTSLPIKVRPSWAVNMVLALLAGLFIGAILALVRDVSLDKVNSSAEAAMIADRAVLGRIPLRGSARDPLISDPQKARAFESYRMLRNSVLLAAGERKAFLVTSSVSKEGKSTIAGNLAIAMALEGKRTIIVDGNLRNPAVHKLFKVAREKGMSEVLSGKATLDECLKTTETANLAILTAGEEAPNPTELVAGTQMKDLVERLKGQADVVIVDAPAAFGFADAQSLVPVIPDVLFVTEIEAPRKQQMREAVGVIDFAKGNILGLILNKDKLAIGRTRAV